MIDDGSNRKGLEVVDVSRWAQLNGLSKGHNFVYRNKLNLLDWSECLRASEQSVADVNLNATFVDIDNVTMRLNCL